MEVDPNESEASEQSVNITLGEEIQGPVNAYGSPVRANSSTQSQSTVSATASAQPSTSGQNINRVVCSCKNTCSRKKSTRYAGCPCQNANLKCCENCKCGTKKAACKNKAEEGQTLVNPSAFARHRKAVEESEKEIKEFVSKMSADDKDKLLIRLLSQGRGSVEFAKHMLTEVPQPLPPEPETARPWCVCGVCRPMRTEEENVCCKKRTCVTSYIMFNNVCLDREVLQLAIRARCDIRADEPDYAPNSYRKAAYRQYTLWKYGKLGRGNRKILPACVVLAIRQAYPAPDGNYMGHRRS